jgi:periplasmic divalent cation tolerance protein
MDCVQVTTTTDSAEEAASLARSVVEARLAACAQVSGPITSTYWWEGDVQTATEWQCVFKTAADRLDALRAHLEAEHPYDTPEIVATAIAGGSAAYLDWLRAETRARA